MDDALTRALEGLGARELVRLTVTTPTSTTFERQGVVRWERKDDPPERAFGVHNFNIRKGGEVELFWGAYDLNHAEACTETMRKFKRLTGARDGARGETP